MDVEREPQLLVEKQCWIRCFCTLVLGTVRQGERQIFGMDLNHSHAMQHCRWEERHCRFWEKDRLSIVKVLFECWISLRYFGKLVMPEELEAVAVWKKSPLMSVRCMGCDKERNCLVSPLIHALQCALVWL